MPDKKSSTPVSAPVKELTAAELMENQKRVLSERFDSIKSSLDSTTNIWVRYKAEILLVELQEVYKLLFK